jgi:signal transduction histidine kinase
MPPTVRPDQRPELVFTGLSDKLKEFEDAVARQQERFGAIMAIGQAIGSTLDLDEILRLVMDHTTRLLRAERSTLYLVDYDRREIWSKVVQGAGLKEIRQPLTRGIAGWVCTHNKAVNIPDVTKDGRFNPEVDRNTGFKTRNMLVVPMHDVTGGVLGAIQALNRRESGFTDEDGALLSAIAAQAGVAIENARLYRDVVTRNRELFDARESLAVAASELDLLYDIEKRISAATSMEDVFDAIIAKAARFVGADAGAILLLSAETGQLYFKSAVGEKGAEAKRYQLNVGEGIAGEVARTGEAIVTNDPDGHEAFDAKISRRIGFSVRSALCVPLLSEGGIIGALELLNKHDGKGFGGADLRVATLIAGQVARAVTVGRGREEGERKARLAMIGQMISGVLHDLRTPMTIISGYAQLMAEEEDSAERRKSAEVIIKQFDHINAMTRETLAFARGEQDILLRKVYLQKFVQEVGAFLAKDLEGKGIELKIQAGYAGAVRMDEDKIKRAIYNIARNAAQAMHAGGKFTFGIEKEDDRVVFRFTDTGSGIPEEIAGKLFQSFVTSGKKDGTGLGLAIVKKVAEAHGGDVSFKSRSGKGTTFTLRIPA